MGSIIPYILTTTNPGGQLVTAHFPKNSGMTGPPVQAPAHPDAWRWEAMAASVAPASSAAPQGRPGSHQVVRQQLSDFF